jgi:cell division septal protein FtsQ
MAQFATRGRREESKARASTQPGTPATSRLTVAKNRGNRRRAAPTASLWSRVPRPRAIANACGRVVRRSMTGLAAVGVLAVVVTGVWLGYRFVTTSPRFAITSIEVRGNQRLAADAIIAELPVHVGDNVFAANVDDITSRLRAEPWIASVDARRILPHTIVVEIRERVAAAVVELGGPYLVDAAGHPFKRAEHDTEIENLPWIDWVDRDAGRARFLRDPDGTAQTICDALAMLATWQADPDRPVVTRVHVDAHGSITLDSATTTIQLGALGPTLPSRIHTFDAAWADLSDDERARARAVHLDVRPDHLTVAFAKD